MTPGKIRLANVMSLAKGTVLAQLIFVLATPVLTRIYSAEQLGTFGLYSALVLVMARFAGLRYELAIPLPKRDQTAINLVLLTAWATLGTLGIAYAAYLFLTRYFNLFTDSHVLHDYAIFILLGVAAFVFNETLIFWFIRKKQFGTIASARVINAFCLALLQLLGFIFQSKLLFLIAAYPAALLVSISYLLKKIDFGLFSYRKSRLPLLKVLSFRYRDFPIYSTMSTGFSEMSQALPLFVLTYFFGDQQAGYFFLARRIGLMPISLVGRAISQVNHADMLEHHKSGSLGQIMVQQIHGLQWISVAPAFLIAYFAPDLCELLFGNGWRVAGVFIQLLTPYVVIRFVFSPLTAINNVAEWQRSGFWFEMVSSAISTACLIVFCMRGDSVTAVGAYFFVQAIANLVYRIFLMNRLDIGALHLLKPGIIQVAALSVLVLLLNVQ